MGNKNSKNNPTTSEGKYQIKKQIESKIKKSGTSIDSAANKMKAPSLNYDFTSQSALDITSDLSKTISTMMSQANGKTIYIYDATRAMVTNVSKDFYCAIGHLHICKEVREIVNKEEVIMEEQCSGTGTLIAPNLVLTAATIF